MVLTKEQFNKAKQAGFSTDQIVEFEKKRSVEQPEKIGGLYTKEQLSSKVIPQITKGLYENVPFGKRVISMLPNAEKIKTIMEGTPSAKGVAPAFGRFMAETSPDLAMMTPFLKGASLIPKLGAIPKFAVGFGTYEGTKKAIEGKQKEVLPAALAAGSSGLALGYAGKGLAKGAEYLSKSGVDYVTTKLAPRAYKIYQNEVKEFSPGIQKFANEKLKIPQAAIDTIKKNGVESIQKIRQAYNDSTDAIYQKILDGFSGKRNLADTAYKKAIEHTPKNFGGTIDVRDTLKTMEGVFKGSLGEATRGPQGQRLFTITKELQGRRPASKGFYAEGSTPTAGQLKRQFKGEKLTDIAGEVRLNKKQFMELRDALNDLYRENPYDRNIAKVMNNLYADGEKAGFKGLQAARDLQRKAFVAERKFINKSTGQLKALGSEKNLDRYQFLPKESIRQMKDIEDYIGVKFIDDVDAITAAREAEKLTSYDIKRFVSDMNRAVDPKYTKFVKEEYRSLIGDSVDKIFDDIVSHRRGAKLKTLVKRGAFIAGSAAAGTGAFNKLSN